MIECVWFSIEAEVASEPATPVTNAKQLQVGICKHGSLYILDCMYKWGMKRPEMSLAQPGPLL